MIALLPASKTLDFASPVPTPAPTQPRFLAEAARLASELRQLSPEQLAARMELSPKLAAQVFGFYQQWRTPFTAANARPALLAYAGDLYDGLEATTFTSVELRFAQAHLRILSGLYGLLRPLDLMQPYRLEMGARMDSGSLAAHWREPLTPALGEDLERERRAGRAPALLNLASEEYAKAVNVAALPGPMITPVFQEGQGSRSRVVSFHAKRARGTMARYVVRHRILEPAALRDFREGGYAFVPEASSPERWVYRRPAS